MAAKKDQLDHIEIFHEHGLHIPTRTIFLETSVENEGASTGQEDGVNYYMAMKFYKNLHLLECINKDPITILMNTNGGDTEQGMGIYDAIVAAKSHVTIKVVGNACSMGCFILQAGDIRTVSPHSSVMFHYGTSGAGGANAWEVKNQAQHEIDFRNRMDKVIYNRLKDKFDKDNKAFNWKKFQDLNMKGKYMLADEAVEWGLADRVE